MLNRNYLAGLFVLLIILGVYFEEQIKLGWGYHVNWLGGTEYNITRHEKIIVEGAIFDYQLISGHLIGLRLPAKEIQCGYKVMRVASDQKMHFILNLDSEILRNFSSKKEFEKAVELFSSIDEFDINLRYKYVESILNNRKIRLDGKDNFRACLKNNGLFGRRVIWLMK